MRRIERSALVRSSPARMFELITRIEAYPTFVPGCVAASIQSTSEPTPGVEEVVASLTIERRGLRETLTTRNRAWPVERVELQLVDGPLQRLDGTWSLAAVGELGCEVSLVIDYELRRGLRLVGSAISGSIGRVADEVLDAFCRQAEHDG